MHRVATKVRKKRQEQTRSKMDGLHQERADPQWQRKAQNRRKWKTSAEGYIGYQARNSNLEKSFKHENRPWPPPIAKLDFTMTLQHVAAHCLILILCRARRWL
ncbi:hypothetical protein PoB_004522700 [Plakobranchus ocellatus]|uniref:Uncharacterized protein n=1 Tax=Plakobranchus ocellatus TaxID=259542 RepID=A0AAV4BIE2_9GAST|nr:hypothetical protein PoB_004522700 [Plakobranchus ocellatus]